MVDNSTFKIGPHSVSMIISCNFIKTLHLDKNLNLGHGGVPCSRQDEVHLGDILCMFRVDRMTHTWANMFKVG